MARVKSMRSQEMDSHAGNARKRLAMNGFACTLALLLASSTFSQSKATEAVPQDQKSFATPKEASDALIEATKTFDVPALTQLLGPAGEDLVASEDPVRDKNIAAAFF